MNLCLFQWICLSPVNKQYSYVKCHNAFCRWCVSSTDTYFQVTFSYLKKKIIEKLLLEYTLFRVYIKVTKGDGFYLSDMATHLLSTAMTKINGFLSYTFPYFINPYGLTIEVQDLESQCNLCCTHGSRRFSMMIVPLPFLKG